MIVSIKNKKMSVTVEDYNNYKIYIDHCMKRLFNQNDKIVIIDDKIYVKLNNCTNLYDINSKAMTRIHNNIIGIITLLKKYSINEIISGNIYGHTFQCNGFESYDILVKMLIGMQLNNLQKENTELRKLIEEIKEKIVN